MLIWFLKVGTCDFDYAGTSDQFQLLVCSKESHAEEYSDCCLTQSSGHVTRWPIVESIESVYPEKFRFLYLHLPWHDFYNEPLLLSGNKLTWHPHKLGSCLKKKLKPLVMKKRMTMKMKFPSCTTEKIVNVQKIRCVNRRNAFASWEAESVRRNAMGI